MAVGPEGPQSMMGIAARAFNSIWQRSAEYSVLADPSTPRY